MVGLIVLQVIAVSLTMTACVADAPVKLQYRPGTLDCLSPRPVEVSDWKPAPTMVRFEMQPTAVPRGDTLKKLITEALMDG